MFSVGGTVIMFQKRAAAIHDISCFGKCSLTVAIPVLSAAGIETCPIPTAMLSTHTGGFTNIHIRDLTDDVMPVAEHWKSLDLRFDAIYTGYLGSFRQLDIVSDFFDKFKSEGTTIIVDPVMADNGRLYGGITDDFPAGMRKLCEKADIITPNLTRLTSCWARSTRTVLTLRSISRVFSAVWEPLAPRPSC